MSPILDAASALSAGASALKPGDGHHDTRWVVDHVSVAGHEVRIDHFAPAGSVVERIVLLVHGAGGLLADGALMRRAARRLVSAGFRACVVHYFNVSGTFFATPAGVAEHADLWRTALEECARHYAEQGGTSVGVLGHAFGGWLALAAAQESVAIGAVAVLNGGHPGPEHLTSAPLPPVLVLHGANDLRVPVEHAEGLGRLAYRTGASVESVIYSNEGHSFGATAERDALRRAEEFFARRLEAGMAG